MVDDFPFVCLCRSGRPRVRGASPPAGGSGPEDTSAEHKERSFSYTGQTLAHLLSR